MKTIDLIPKQQDSVIAEVHRIKQERAEKFNYDVTAMARDLQAQEKGDPRFIQLKNPSLASPCPDRQ